MGDDLGESYQSSCNDGSAIKSIINSNQQNHLILNDPNLNLKPTVHILRLPESMIESRLPASYLDEIYSILNDNLFKSEINYIHRHLIIRPDDDSESMSSSTSKLHNKRKRGQSEEEIGVNCDGGQLSKKISFEHSFWDDSTDYSSDETVDHININQSLADMISLSSDDEATQSNSRLLASSDSANFCPEMKTIPTVPSFQSQKSPISRKVPPIHPFPEYKLTLLPWLETNGSPNQNVSTKITSIAESNLKSIPIESPTKPFFNHDLLRTPTSPPEPLPRPPCLNLNYYSSSFLTFQRNSLKATPTTKVISSNNLSMSNLKPAERFLMDIDERRSRPKVGVKDIKDVKESQKMENTKKIPVNWLDASRVKFKLPMIIEIKNGKGNLEDGRKTRSIFRSIYDKFGKYFNEIADIKIFSYSIKLYFNSEKSRTKIQRELEGIIHKVNYKLFIRFPSLENPCIHFQVNFKIDLPNQYKWLNKIKKLNNWPSNSLVTWQLTVPRRDKFMVKISVTSRIRTMIEEKNGLIRIDDKTVVGVIDDISPSQCFKCYKFGHLQATCKRSVTCKCFFCGEISHETDSCSVRNKPEKWFCLSCKVTGHTVVSKECPALLSILESKLEKIDHHYKFIFLNWTKGLTDCENILSRQCKPLPTNRLGMDRGQSTCTKGKSGTDLKSLIDSLVDSKMINPQSSEQIYQKLKDHLGSV